MAEATFSLPHSPTASSPLPLLSTTTSRLLDLSQISPSRPFLSVYPYHHLPIAGHRRPPPHPVEPGGVGEQEIVGQDGEVLCSSSVHDVEEEEVCTRRTPTRPRPNPRTPAVCIVADRQLLCPNHHRQQPTGEPPSLPDMSRLAVPP